MSIVSESFLPTWSLHLWMILHVIGISGRTSRVWYFLKCKPTGFWSSLLKLALRCSRYRSLTGLIHSPMYDSLHSEQVTSYTTFPTPHRESRPASQAKHRPLSSAQVGPRMSLEVSSLRRVLRFDQAMLHSSRRDYQGFEIARNWLVLLLIRFARTCQF